MGDDVTGSRASGKSLTRVPRPHQRVGAAKRRRSSSQRQPSARRAGTDVEAEEEGRRAGRQRVGAVGPGAGGALPPPDGDEAEHEEGRHAEGEAILPHRRGVRPPPARRGSPRAAGTGPGSAGWRQVPPEGEGVGAVEGDIRLPPVAGQPDADQGPYQVEGEEDARDAPPGEGAEPVDRGMIPAPGRFAPAAGPGPAPPGSEGTSTGWDRCVWLACGAPNRWMLCFGRWLPPPGGWVEVPEPRVWGSAKGIRRRGASVGTLHPTRCAEPDRGDLPTTAGWLVGRRGTVRAWRCR